MAVHYGFVLWIRIRVSLRRLVLHITISLTHPLTEITRLPSSSVVFHGHPSAFHRPRLKTPVYSASAPCRPLLRHLSQIVIVQSRRVLNLPSVMRERFVKVSRRQERPTAEARRWEGREAVMRANGLLPERKKAWQEKSFLSWGALALSPVVARPSKWIGHAWPSSDPDNGD